MILPGRADVRRLLDLGRLSPPFCDRALEIERGILLQDRRLELPQPPARLDPELLDQRATRSSVRIQGLGLAPGPVEGEHELLAGALAKRLRGDERLKLADELGMSPAVEVGLDAILEDRESELLEARDLPLGEVGEGDLRERRATPERERLPQLARRRGWIAGGKRLAPLRCQALEETEVKFVGLEPQEVAGCAGDQHPPGLAGRAVGLERLAQLRDVNLKRLRGGLGSLGAPELVDQAVGRRRPGWRSAAGSRAGCAAWAPRARAIRRCRRLRAVRGPGTRPPFFSPGDFTAAFRPFTSHRGAC